MMLRIPALWIWVTTISRNGGANGAVNFGIGENTNVVLKGFTLTGDGCEATYCCIENGGGGTNIDDDPCFVDPNNGDYHLASNSPCIDAGDNSVVSSDEEDIYYEERIIDGDNDGTAIVDIGADEYDPNS